MALTGKIGHELIRETPLTLLALTRHSVERHEQDWFARCRGDYLRSFPHNLLELVRIAVLMLLVMPVGNVLFGVTAVAGWAVITMLEVSVRRHEAQPQFSPELTLLYRRGTIRIRAIWWLAMLAWSIHIVPSDSEAALVLLGTVMMVVDGISILSLPLLALAISAASGATIALSLFAREGLSAAPVSIVMLVLAAFMHWSIFNLYYLFATRRIRTRRLAESNETISILLNQYDDEGSDWLYEIDMEGRVLKPSQRFCAACALEPGELEGLPFTALFPEQSIRQELAARFERAESFRDLSLPLQINGEDRWWSISGRPVRCHNGQLSGWRGFVADISEKKIAEARIAHMAHFDQLTGLPNRMLLTASLDRALSRSSPRRSIGLLFVDLDHFKDVNDGLGHATGDALLQEIARRLERAVRPGDMVARLGGDEFVVLFSDLASQDICFDVAHRLLQNLAEPIEVDGQTMRIGASLGAAFAPDHGATGRELLQAADLAMYQAKLSGRNRVGVFDPSLREQVQDRRDLANGMRQAIARDEFVLHFQPLIDIGSGATTGYEALVRWKHPQRGLLGPDRFIAIAEETSFIGELGEWVLRSAIAEAATWPEGLVVAVNVSPAQMHKSGFVEIVADALAQSGLKPDRLEIEITENLFIRDQEAVLDLLRKLRSMGVRISLDDFGTGYSSFNYLHTFPFDKIKIDASFVSNVVEREDCQAIIQSVLSLASELDISAIAEGVETQDQLHVLRQMGCMQAQGYLFSRAVPSSDLPFERKCAAGSWQKAIALDGVDASSEVRAERVKRTA